MDMYKTFPLQAPNRSHWIHPQEHHLYYDIMRLVFFHIEMTSDQIPAWQREIMGIQIMVNEKFMRRQYNSHMEYALICLDV